MRNGPAWARLLAATVLGGCAPREDSIVVDETANLRYVVSGPTAEEAVDELCGGTAEYLDAYARELKVRLSAPSDAQVTYVWAPAGVDALGSCKSIPSALGCASGGKAVGSVPVLEHELVHAVRQLSGKRSEPFVEEGLAEFLGGRQPEGQLPDVANLEQAIVDTAAGTPWTSDRLAIAGHFVSFIITEVGLEIDRLATLQGSGEDLLEDVSTLVATSAEALRASYEEHPRSRNIGYRDGSVSCAAARRIDGGWTNDSFELRDAFGCSDASSFGWSSGVVSQTYAFPVMAAGCYDLEFTTSKDDTQIWLEQCGASISRTNLLLGYQSAVFLGEGEHIVTVRTPGSTGSESFVLRVMRNPRTESDCF